MSHVIGWRELHEGSQAVIGPVLSKNRGPKENQPQIKYMYNEGHRKSGEDELTNKPPRCGGVMGINSPSRTAFLLCCSLQIASGSTTLGSRVETLPMSKRTSKLLLRLTLVWPSTLLA